MKFLIFLILWVNLAIHTGAQNYQTINQQRIVLFKNPANKIIGLRVDSVKIESDTILYPFTTIQEVSAEGCFSPNKASWIGEKIIVKQDGFNLFFNRDGDTITLNTRAQLNESWIAFHRADTFQVEATVNNIEFEEFLGLNDSVKTITFRVIDQKNNTIDNELNNLKVKISQNYGFVETLNFYLFPDITVRITGDRPGTHTLVGLTNPNFGIQNLKWFDVYDFNVQDELHILEKVTGDEQFTPISEYEKKSIIKYLERIDYNDSIVYHLARKESIKTVYRDTSSLTINTDTVKQVIRANPAFDKLPGEPIRDAGLLYSFYMKDVEFLKKTDQMDTQQFLFGNNCWNLAAGEGCLREMNYLKGLGGPYYFCKGYFGDTKERILVYYKKGEAEWGERMIITNIPAVKTSEMIKVFPNPAKNEINISIHSNKQILSLELVDLSGSGIYQKNAVHSNTFHLNVCRFPKGIYILKVETNNDIISQRVVIH